MKLKFTIEKSKLALKRIFARLFDIYLIIGFLSILLKFCLILFANLPENQNLFDYIGNILILSALINPIYEIIMIHRYGYTYGKFLFGISLTNNKGNKISFLSSILRVSIIYIPLILAQNNFLLYLIEVFFLVQLFSGNILWDDILKINISNIPIEPRSVTIYTIALFIVIYIPYTLK